MSFEQTAFDTGDIERAKRQIRTLVGEIAGLTKTGVAPEEFYGQFLPRVVSALAAIGGAVWTLNPEGQLALQYQINIQETKLRDDEQKMAQHGRLLGKMLTCGNGMLVPPHSGPGEAAESEPEAAANPTDFLLVFGLLKSDLETVGLVEIFQRFESGAEAQAGYLRFLAQMCELAGDFLKTHQLRHFSDRQTLWTQLEDFTRTVHASLNPQETAYTIVNEGRRLIECDRVSVAIRRGRKCKIEAISGQDMFDKRSNTVRLLGKLATAVVATGEAVWYTGDTRDLAPQVEDAVQEYVDEAHSKTVAILPLQRPTPQDDDDPRKRVEPEPPIGALIVELIEDSRVSPNVAHRADVVRQHCSTALANAMEHQNLFLMPVWRALGKTKIIFQARTLPKTVAVAAGVLLLTLVLCLWPAQLTMESKGALEPAQRQDVFAGIDGKVEDLKVAHDDHVTRGQLLLKLGANSDFEVQRDQIEGELQAGLKRLNAVNQAMTNPKLSVEERNRLAGEQAELQPKVEALNAERAVLRQKEAELEIRSPIDGVVVTFDLWNRLINRPVERGQALLRVANIDGPWQLELHMPENHMGHVLEAQRKKYDQSRQKLRELLREQLRGKLHDASDEQLGEAVEKALAEIPDEQLHNKVQEFYLAGFHGQIEKIATEVTDETLRARLDPLLHAANDDEAEEQFDKLVGGLKTEIDAAKAQEAKQAEDARKAEEAKAQEAKAQEAKAQEAKAQAAKPAEDAKKSQQPPTANEGANPAAPPTPAPTSPEPGKTDEPPKAGAPAQSTSAAEQLLARLQALPREKLPDDRLTVSYILATDPSVKHEGKVVEIHRTAEVWGEEGNTVLMKVKIDKSDLASRSPGTGVTAKVDCGRRSLGYVLLHDVIGWIQKACFRWL